MAMEYFPCFYAYRRKIVKLSDQEVGRLFRSLMEYGETGETQELTGREALAFDFIADDIDRAKANYEAKAESKRDAGRKGGLSKASTTKQCLANLAEPSKPSKCLEVEEEKETEEKTETNLSPTGESRGAHAPTPAPERPRRRARQSFTPPTLAEVAAYCQERHNGIDPQHFLDYYTANGWVQGKGKPIQDWQATLRTWERNNTARPRQNATPTAAEYLAAPPSQSELESIRQMQEFMAKHGGGAGDNTGD